MKLHLGCGERYLNGYVHVDIAEFDHIDFIRPVDDLSCFKKNTVSEIYASHVLEYFDKEYAPEVLNEWKRVLKPNGILRIAVPNFPKLIEIYESSQSLESIVGPLYGKWDIGNNQYIYHKTVYDFTSLKQVLEEVGFKNISYWESKLTKFNIEIIEGPVNRIGATSNLLSIYCYDPDGNLIEISNVVQKK